jgi:hypothetical protein
MNPSLVLIGEGDDGFSDANANKFLVDFLTKIIMSARHPFLFRGI